MAKKTKSKKPSKTAKAPKRKSIPITHEMWLEHLIMVTEKNISPQGNTLDEFFAQQAARLKNELKEYRKNK